MQKLAPEELEVDEVLSIRRGQRSGRRECGLCSFFHYQKVKRILVMAVARMLKKFLAILLKKTSLLAKEVVLQIDRRLDKQFSL
jgi:hypothetical protein